jgi:[ribosomal protein S5]-alanine N-acetyltransferase
MPWTTEIIRSERLTLRCPIDDDRVAIVRILTDRAVREFLGGPVSGSVVARFEALPIGEQEGLFVAVLTETGQTIGTFAIEDERADRELSYQLLPEFWGFGFALEACSALLGWFWQTTELESTIAVTHSLNTRSKTLLQRLGFGADREFEEDEMPHTQMRLQRPA